MLPEEIFQKAAQVMTLCQQRKLKLATAESCTGGLVSAILTDIPGASKNFLGAIVAYDNEVKHDYLRVSYESLDKNGAASEQAAREMAYGICLELQADCAVAITGIAGPDGGTEKKPVGTVHLAVCLKHEIIHRTHVFPGTRQEVRLAAAETAIDMLLEALQTSED